MSPTDAQAIIDSVGGATFLAANGASHFMPSPDGLWMRISPEKARNKICAARITRTAPDRFAVSTFRLELSPSAHFALVETAHADDSAIRSLFVEMTAIRRPFARTR